MDAPLDQTRQLMASHLPEYRPFALQEVLRAAKLRGGAAVAAPVKQGRPAEPRLTGPLSRVPAWLDICLYACTAVVVGVALFMGLYHLYVKPCEPDADDSAQHTNSRRLYDAALRASVPSEVGSGTSPNPGNVFPPHPPGPPPLAR